MWFFLAEYWNLGKLFFSLNFLTQRVNILFILKKLFKKGLWILAVTTPVFLSLGLWYIKDINEIKEETWCNGQQHMRPQKKKGGTTKYLRYEGLAIF